MIEFQRLILGDRRRNELFAEALRRVIVPGVTTVADLGSGTGFLSFVASRLGAKRCFLYEVSEMLELSREIAKANRVTNCTFVRAHSTEVADPPKVDLVVSETLGNLALEENTLETLQDARRFLAPGGTIVPQKLAQFVAPVVSARHFEALDVWSMLAQFGRAEGGPGERRGGASGKRSNDVRRDASGSGGTGSAARGATGAGLDFSAARRVSLDNVYVRTFERSDLLDGGRGDSRQSFDSLDFRERNASVRRATVEWKLAKATRLFGFALWWECELLAGVPELVLSTAPDAPRTHWEQIWLPPRDPIDAKAGETLRLWIECDSRPAVKINVKWRTTLLDRSGATRLEQTHDMRKGHLE